MTFPVLLAFLPGPAAQDAQLASVWLLAGLYVLTGLVAGAACGYLAVSRGLPAVPWFFAGFILNVLALCVLLTRPGRQPGADDVPGDVVPRGLRKVEHTFAPVACPGCGSPQHPAASRCAACGGSLSPSTSSEMSRT